MGKGSQTGYKKIVEEYVVAFVKGSDGSVVGFLGRDRMLTERREMAFEFDEDHSGIPKLLASAKSQLARCAPGVRIEVKELWEL